MGDPACELADGFHLLGLSQLLFQRPPLGHVFRNGFEALDRAVGPPDRAPREPHADLAPVTPPPSDLRALDRVSRFEPRQYPPPLIGIRVHVALEVHRPQLVLGLVAEHPDQRRVHREESTRDRRPVNAVGGMLHQRAVTLIRAAECVFGPAPFRDVRPHPDHTRHAPIGVAHR